MADIIIIGVLGVVVFFIAKGEFRRVRKGQCGGGCAGCSGCHGCSCGGNACGSPEGTEKVKRADS